MTFLGFVVQMHTKAARLLHRLALYVAILGQVAIRETSEALLELSPVLEFFMTLSWYEKVVFQRLHGAGAL